jgi:hypothetical protein
VADGHVSPLTDPDTEVVSSAAYLLFYRRRSDRPLGGPRFETIFKEYAQKDSDTEMGAGSGDEQGQNGSSLYGTLGMVTRGGGGASLVEMTDASVENPPSYGPVRPSIEEENDEGIGMALPNQTSFVQQQQWSFASLDAAVDNNKGKSKLVDYNSDSAQQDSASERDDVDSMAPGGGSRSSLPDNPLPDEPSQELPDYYEEPEEPRNPSLEDMMADNDVVWASIGASQYRNDDQDEAAVDIHPDENPKDGKSPG